MVSFRLIAIGEVTDTPDAGGQLVSCRGSRPRVRQHELRTRRFPPARAVAVVRDARDDVVQLYLGDL